MSNQSQSIAKTTSKQAAQKSYTGFLSNFWNMFDNSDNELNNMEPKIEIAETKSNIVVAAELPGIDEKDIRLEISPNGYLTINGEKQHSRSGSSKGYHFSEISYGHINRTIPLPWKLNYKQASAEFDNGILTVLIPKAEAEQAQSQTIEVRNNQTDNQPAPTTKQANSASNQSNEPGAKNKQSSQTQQSRGRRGRKKQQKSEK